MTLPIDKMNERGIIVTHVVNACLPKVTWYWPQKEHLTGATRRSASVIEVSGRMHSNAFKRKLAFGFALIILA